MQQRQSLLALSPLLALLLSLLSVCCAQPCPSNASVPLCPVDATVFSCDVTTGWSIACKTSQVTPHSRVEITTPVRINGSLSIPKNVHLTFHVLRSNISDPFISVSGVLLLNKMRVFILPAHLPAPNDTLVTLFFARAVDAKGVDFHVNTSLIRKPLRRCQTVRAFRVTDVPDNIIVVRLHTERVNQRCSKALSTADIIVASVIGGLAFCVVISAVLVLVGRSLYKKRYGGQKAANAGGDGASEGVAGAGAAEGASGGGAAEGANGSAATKPVGDQTF